MDPMYYSKKKKEVNLETIGKLNLNIEDKRITLQQNVITQLNQTLKEKNVKNQK
jgi:hypothetical protein